MKCRIPSKTDEIAFDLAATATMVPILAFQVSNAATSRAGSGRRICATSACYAMCTAHSTSFAAMRSRHVLDTAQISSGCSAHRIARWTAARSTRGVNYGAEHDYQFNNHWRQLAAVQQQLERQLGLPALVAERVAHSKALRSRLLHADGLPMLARRIKALRQAPPLGLGTRLADAVLEQWPQARAALFGFIRTLSDGPYRPGLNTKHSLMQFMWAP